MAYRVKIMPRAERDLVGIFDWVGAGSSKVAAAWYWGLKDSIAALRNSPLRCPRTPESKDLRHLLYGRKPHVYRVIFRMADRDRQVEVLTVRHGAMDRFDPESLP
jgi:plasmid stabilization system protein ParE